MQRECSEKVYIFYSTCGLVNEMYVQDWQVDVDYVANIVSLRLMLLQGETLSPRQSGKVYIRLLCRQEKLNSLTPSLTLQE